MKMCLKPLSPISYFISVTYQHVQMSCAHATCLRSAMLIANL